MHSVWRPTNVVVRLYDKIIVRLLSLVKFKASSFTTNLLRITFSSAYQRWHTLHIVSLQNTSKD